MSCQHCKCTRVGPLTRNEDALFARMNPPCHHDVRKTTYRYPRHQIEIGWILSIPAAHRVPDNSITAIES